jgi:hypothetical protein
MKAWFLVFLLFITGSCLVTNVSLNAAQGPREALQIDNNLIKELVIASAKNSKDMLKPNNPNQKDRFAKYDLVYYRP